MLHIALVEDTAFDRQVLRSCLEEYRRETSTEMEIREFASGKDFLEHFPEGVDLIFMDIMMDEMDGLTAARQLRRRDEKVLLVFVTSMFQYAVQGYSVDAMDFLLKPVTPTAVKLCMDHALRRLQQSAPVCLSFSNREGIHAIPASDIYYIEALQHRIIIHTKDRTLQIDSSLASAEKMVAALPFFRCHASFLINLAYVDRISGNSVWVSGEELAISRYRRKEFLDAWAAYLG